MEQQDFLKKTELRTPEKEIDVRTVLAKNSALREENVELKEQLAQLKKVVYGQKSEKTEVILDNAEQLPLFNEAEEESDTDPRVLHTTEVQSHQRKPKRTHDEMAADLSVEEVHHTVEDRTCDKCGSEMVVIGKEKIRDEVVYVPARLFLRRHYAEVVKCSSCGMDESRGAELPDIEMKPWYRCCVSQTKNINFTAERMCSDDHHHLHWRAEPRRPLPLRVPILPAPVQ